MPKSKFKLWENFRSDGTVDVRVSADGVLLTDFQSDLAPKYISLINSIRFNVNKNTFLLFELKALKKTLGDHSTGGMYSCKFYSQYVDWLMKNNAWSEDWQDDDSKFGYYGIARVDFPT